MGSAVPVFKADAILGVPCDLFGRITAFGAGGAVSPVAGECKLLIQSDVSSIALSYWSGGQQIGSTTNPAASSVLFNTLQTGAGWDNIKDGNGGNAHWQVPQTILDSAPLIQMQMVFTLADSTTAKWFVDITVKQ